jgi:hypothetical protein
MQSRLTVEDHEITIHNMSFYDHSKIQLDILSILDISEVKLFPIVSDNRLSARIHTRAIDNQLFEFFDIELSDSFWES